MAVSFKTIQDRVGPPSYGRGRDVTVDGTAIFWVSLKPSDFARTTLSANFLSITVG